MATMTRVASTARTAKRAGKDTAPASCFVLPPLTRGDRTALALLMAASALVFFVNLTASGYANEFYSAAAQAGSVNWEAFLWGSSDAGNAITVDKPPAAIWLMALSVRIFGLSSFAILLPEALCGVATTYLIYATTRRYWGPKAGIVAGTAFITTPVAALMFRFNNPDALLILLMTGATYAVLRSLEYDTTRRGNRRRTWWMVLAGALIGLGFLTKQLQAFLVLPGFALAFLVASPTGWARRIGDGLAAVGAIVVAAGWWVLLTVIVPADSRPYIGGSQNNSFIELTFGYNGLGRLTGDEEGSVIPGSTATKAQGGMWGATGLTRLFGSDYAGQITWLAPLALAGIVIGLIVAGRAARTDLRRASVLAWGSWLAVTWLTFSLMRGIFHQYYTVALAPAVAILAAIAVVGLWHERRSLAARIAAPALCAIEAVWCWHVWLLCSPSWHVGLAWAALFAGLLGAVGLIGAGAAAGEDDTAAPTGGAEPAGAADALANGSGTSPRALRTVTFAACALAAVGCLTGPVAWTLATISTGHTGSIVTAGPSSSGRGGMGGGMPGGHGGSGGQSGGFPGGGEMPSLPGGASGTASEGGQSQGKPDNASATGERSGGRDGGHNGSGLLGGGGSSVNTELVTLLQTDADSYRWAAATTGSQNAASYQLASEVPVMAIGGFNGSDDYPTLDQFKEYVAQGLIHYYIAGGGMGGGQMGGSDAASAIEQWVEANFTAQSVGGVTVYDLTE